MRWFHPWQPIALALLLTGIFVSVDLLGWHQYAVILSGTMVWDAPTNGVTQGMVYIGSWLMWAVFAPILFGGGLLWWAVERVRGRGTEH